MTSSRRDRNQLTDRQARRTVLLVGSVLVAIGAVSIFRRRILAAEAFGAAALALFLVCLSSRAARRFHLAWMGLSRALGAFNNRLITLLVFVFIFIPYGFFSRLPGRDPLDRRSKKRDSYWVRRKTTRQSHAQFERMF